MFYSKLNFNLPSFFLKINPLTLHACYSNIHCRVLLLSLSAKYPAHSSGCTQNV